MEDTDTAIGSLTRLKNAGLRISVDDFGTGHSCLSYLRRFPIDVLKIDRSFVSRIGGSEDDAIIIRAIISLAKSLKLETVAEGVETRDQLQFLMENGCKVAQGFLFGLPRKADSISRLLPKPGDGPKELTVVTREAAAAVREMVEAEKEQEETAKWKHRAIKIGSS